jgi:hypothetical protein
MLPVPEPIAPRHVLDGFDCGEPEINRYLHHDALAHAQVGFAQTWVIAQARTHAVQGFISLSAASQAVRVRDGASTKKLVTGVIASCPYPDAPMLMIGRLGRHKDLAKSGIGARLLTFAIVKAVRLSEEIGIAGIILDAMTDDLLSYYQKQRFERLPYPDKRKRRMLLTIANAKAALDEARG